MPRDILPGLRMLECDEEGLGEAAPVLVRTMAAALIQAVEEGYGNSQQAE
jgi:hypothetical protein